MTIGNLAAPSTESNFEVIPSIDILAGKVVRLVKGEFSSAKIYGDPLAIVDGWAAPPGTTIHMVDLEGSRSGAPVELETARALTRRGYRLQVGGGIRTLGDAEKWFEAGAARVVIGTVAADSPELFSRIIGRFGAERVVAAVDVLEGRVRVAGWEQSSSRPLSEVLKTLSSSGVRDVLMTDISHDGTLRGPSFGFYRNLEIPQSMRIIASGGVALLSDLISLRRIPSVGGVVIGKALHEGRFTFAAAQRRVATASTLADRVIPCLDVRGGRVVKGVRFQAIRDAGDPVEAARRYEAEGADELIVLDISATHEERAASLETLRAVAEALFIPLTVGGGVRSVDDFRRLIRAGADRVAINSAAVIDPDLISRVADEFGRQAVVLACDARKQGTGYKVVTRAGTVETELEAIEWCARAEALGAGEILLTSIDRDGTGDGFEIQLLRAASSLVGVGVIASGGAGRIEHFREAIEEGGAQAVLAASLFHDGVLRIGEVKQFLASSGIPVRRISTAWESLAVETLVYRGRPRPPLFESDPELEQH